MLIWCSNLFLYSILRTYFYRNRSPFLWLWLSESSIELFCTIACLYYNFWLIECILDENVLFSLKLSMGRLTPTCGSLISGTEIRELWWKVAFVLRLSISNNTLACAASLIRHTEVSSTMGIWVDPLLPAGRWALCVSTGNPSLQLKLTLLLRSDSLYSPGLPQLIWQIN